MGLSLCSQCVQKEPVIGLDVTDDWEKDSEESSGIIFMPNDDLDSFRRLSNSAFNTKRQFYRGPVGRPELRKVKSEGAWCSRVPVVTPEFRAANSFGERHSREPSLVQRLHERHSCSSSPLGYYNNDEVFDAKSYMCTLEKDTLMSIKDANRIAQSMVQKGNDISSELVRQGAVTSSAYCNILNTEQEIHRTSYALNEMSVTGRFANRFLRRKSRQHELDAFDDEEEGGTLSRRKTLPANFSYRCSSKDTKQQQIKDNVEQLIGAMDIIEDQQRGIAEELEYQKPHLRMINEHVGHVQVEITRQTTQMRDLQH